MLRKVCPALALASGLFGLVGVSTPLIAAPLPQAPFGLAPEAPLIDVCHRGYRHFSGRPCGYGYGYGYGYRPHRYGPPLYSAPGRYGRQVCRWRYDQWGRPVQVCRWR